MRVRARRSLAKARWRVFSSFQQLGGEERPFASLAFVGVGSKDLNTQCNSCVPFPAAQPVASVQEDQAAIRVSIRGVQLGLLAWKGACIAQHGTGQAHVMMMPL